VYSTYLFAATTCIKEVAAIKSVGQPPMSATDGSPRTSHDMYQVSNCRGAHPTTTLPDVTFARKVNSWITIFPSDTTSMLLTPASCTVKAPWCKQSAP